MKRIVSYCLFLSLFGSAVLFSSDYKKQSLKNKFRFFNANKEKTSEQWFDNRNQITVLREENNQLKDLNSLFKARLRTLRNSFEDRSKENIELKNLVEEKNKKIKELKGLKGNEKLYKESCKENEKLKKIIECMEKKLRWVSDEMIENAKAYNDASSLHEASYSILLRLFTKEKKRADKLKAQLNDIKKNAVGSDNTIFYYQDPEQRHVVESILDILSEK